MPTSDSARRRHGFTLLEVLVALAISALGVGALVEAASGGLTNVDVATQYLTALHHAQSHLASVGVETALAAGEQDGDDGDGYHWRIKITPVLAGARAADVGRPPLNSATPISPINASTIRSSRRVKPAHSAGSDREIIEAQHGRDQRGDDAGDRQSRDDGDDRNDEAGQAL